MDIDLLCFSFATCFVALCIESPELFFKTCSLVVLVVSVVYLKFIAVKSKKHAVPVRKCVLSGKYPPPNLPAISLPVTTTKVDSLITEVISLSLRDFVFSWCSPPLAAKTQKVSDMATTLSWQLVYLIQIKLNEMDIVTLLSQDIMIKVHSHFKSIRDKQFDFKDYLNNETDEECCTLPAVTCSHGNEEKAFLKRAGIITLCSITPRCIWLSPLFTELIGDILSSYVLFPLICKIAQPDYLYQCILPFIDTIGSPIKKQRFFTQAKTYEDFIKKINKETDLNKLRQLRYKVIAEIMQSMTIENLKQEEDVDGLLSQINSKSYRLSTRNLTRYINQCKVAKMTCEKRIHDVTKIQKRKPHYADMRFKDSETKLLELDEILYSPYVLPFFVQYLEKQQDYGPLKLWLIIEQCRMLECKPEEMYPLIKQGYLDHLTVTSPLRAHQVSRHLVRMAEAYVEHKSGYWQFMYEIQDEIYTMLLEQHYKPFLISSQYMQYVCSTEGKRCKSVIQEFSLSQLDPLGSGGVAQNLSSDSKMNTLKEELKSKQVLLDTLDVMNYCSEEELSQLQEEITSLRVTINQLEHHSDRADLWWKYLGEWRVVVDNVTSNPDPLYTILVKRHQNPREEILPFNNESKFKLTQFNLKNNRLTPRTGAVCVCGKKISSNREQDNPPVERLGKCRTESSLTARSDMLVDETGEVEIDNVAERGELVSRRYSDTPSECQSALEIEVPQSYQSLAPHSMLVRSDSESVDTISVSTLMFTPNDAGLYMSSTASSDNDGTLVSQISETGTAEFHPQYSESSSPPTVSLDANFPLGAPSSPPTLSLGANFPLSANFSADPHFVSPQSEYLASDTSLALAKPQFEGISSPEHLAVSLYPKLDVDESDADTLSACSDDFPPNFMFDDIFYQGDSMTSSISSLETPPQDTPSEKVRRYLTEYTAETTSNNQCDDDKLRALNRGSSVGSNVDSHADSNVDSNVDINEDSNLDCRRESSSSWVYTNEDSSSESSSSDDKDPYLVIEIQSMPSGSAAPQLLEGARQASLENTTEYVEMCDVCQMHRETDEESDKPVENEENECDSEIQTGWIVTQPWEQVKHLYLSLRGCKAAGYPPSFPVSLPKDDSQISASKEHVADFLNFVLRDKTLSQSEQVYRFFNPSCDLLYRAPTSKTGLGEVREDKHKDSIAIPFYTLLGEIFEIHGHLQWLRRQIIYLVRITFGSTIERQIYRALGWAASEQQLIWYTQCLKSSLWCNLSPAVPPSGEGDAAERRKRVRGCLLNTPPHLLVVLFGASKTKKGLTKILDTLEVPRHGKHLMYTTLELLLLHFIGNQHEGAIASGVK